MNKISKTDWTLLQSLIFVVILYAWIMLLGAVFGIFYPLVLGIIWLIICLILYKKNIIKFTRPTSQFLTYILMATSFSLFIALLTVPTIFSGRDQGSLSEASMRLALNHSLIQHTPESDVFFDIYGRGKALNFPGFFYTADGGLITQFPLPYISFLGSFYGVFGINGLIVANCILLFVFILTITSVAIRFMTYHYTLIFLGLLLSSFSIGWFGKFTLSENLSATLLWSAIAIYLTLKKTPSRTTFFLFILTISLLLFSRIEGIWFFFIFLFLLLRNKTILSFIKKDLWWRGVFPSTVLFVIACSIIIVNFPFLLTMIKIGTSSLSNNINPTNSLEKMSYLFSVYSIYGLILPLIITAIGSVIALWNKKYRSILFFIVIIFPLAIYYIFPHISGDHPWMLRRFVFALLPTTILVSVIFISRIHCANLLQRTFKYTVLILLFLANIPAFATFILYTQDTNLFEQSFQLAQNFTNNDLILVDKNVSGNGWSMITNPLRLEGKHAVYFFNPYDFAKINTDKFEHIFLIVPNKNKKLYTDVLSDNMKYITKYTITTNQLSLPKTKTIPPTFPKKQTLTTINTIYELKNK